MQRLNLISLPYLNTFPINILLFNFITFKSTGVKIKKILFLKLYRVSTVNSNISGGPFKPANIFYALKYNIFSISSGLS